MKYNFDIDKVIELINKNILTPAGEEKLFELKPSGKIESIKQEFRKIKEFEKIKMEGEFVFEFPDLENFKNIYFKEKIFTLSELFIFLKFLEGIDKLKIFINQSDFLKEIFFTDYDNIFFLLKELKDVFTEKGEIRDDATPELYRIRVEKKRLMNRIFSMLKKKVQELSKTEFLKDEEIRIREGRFVILVDRSVAGKTGVVHGYSRKELSAYVEPFEVVDIQNDYKEIEEDERREIERICINFSKIIWENTSIIKNIYKDLGEIDLINAKLLFSRAINGDEPCYSKRKFFSLRKVYHPLLYLKKKENAVPYNFDLPEEIDIFVISGPNGGGKTVFLKTLGLIVNMLKLAIPVPSSPDSHFYIPDGIHGIGFETEGSIEEGESNFTAHLKSFKKIIDDSKEDSLILVDEYMGNTDPDEGSALGFSIIKEILNKNTKAFFVTHLNGIKAFVEKENDRRIKNASFGFDPLKKIPTYRLNLGSFESSFAFEIAEKAGLQRQVLERAKGYSSGIGKILKEMKQRMEKMELEQKMWFERERKKLDQEKKEMEKSLIKRLEEIEKEMEDIIDQIKKEKNIKKVNEAKKRILYHKKSLQRKLPEDIKVGAFYEIDGFSSPGEVIAVDKDRVLMKIGTLKVWTEKDKLILSSKKVHKEENIETLTYIPSMKNYSISVRGLKREDALEQVERFVYESYAQGIEEVRILHGLGEGILKRAIWDYLKGVKFVSDFFHPPYYEGGYGVTVVKFKND